MSSTGDPGGLSPLKQALLAVQTMRARVAELERAANEPIAIVGAGMRFPGGVVDRASYWRLLAGGVDAIREVPPDRWDLDRWYDPDPNAPGKMAIREGGFLDDVATFDAEFFGISPREALEMDPAQRLLLQVAWEALEDAAVPADRIAGSQTGVYIGLGLSDYARRHFLSSRPERLGSYSGTGSFLSVAAGRLSYFLGLHGPAVTVDTACSSSLVGVHLAVSALRNRECDFALAGGANLVLAPEPTVYFSQIHAMSPTGRCRTFDAAADGYVRGEGAGVVVLQRLSDAIASGRRILAVIRGSAVNQDGRSNGLTAPSAKAQAAVLRAALANAGVAPGQVGLVEAHGTGTPLGDPIEFEALRAVYGVEGVPLRLGSVKTNFGHLETAAGVAGLIKAALALHARAVPPHLHLNTVNPRISLDGTRMEIARDGAEWASDGPRFAAVSSFGLSGTNAHVILEEAPAREAKPVDGPAVVPLSARDDRALAALARRWADAIEANHLSPGEVGRVAALGRAALGHRRAVVGATREELVARLREPGEAAQAPSRAPMVAFLFTGQGSQYPGMCRGLYDASPVFRDTVDRVFAALELPLREAMWGDDRVHQTAFTQPALYAIEVGIARVWESWGVVPDLMLGHSIGEIAAAALAGVFSIEDGARLVAERGRLMQSLPQDGAMLAVFADEATVRGLVAPHASTVDVSGQNGPTETVVSGRAEGVEAIAQAAAERGIKTRRLTVSHAFHSPSMDPILDAFEAFVAGLPRNAPTRTIVSDLDGQEAGLRHTDPRYWRDHLRRAVRFADGFAALRAAGATAFVEIGPKPILTGMAQRNAGDGVGLSWIASATDEGDAWVNLLQAAGSAWVAGIPVAWDAVYPERGAWPDLPLYPWGGDRYWLEPDEAPAADAVDPVWEIAWRSAPIGEARPGSWRVLGSDALAAALSAVDGPAENTLLVSGGGAPEDEVRRALEALRGGGRLWIAWNEGDLAGAALGGLGRTIAVESPERWGGTVEIVGEPDFAAVAASLRAGDEDQVQLRGAERRAARLVRGRKALGEPWSIDPGRAWLVTGGFGAVGLQIARGLVEAGCRHLVLVGRSGAAKAEKEVEALGARGVRVDALALDVARIADAELPALQGIVHAAGTSHDALLDAITPDQVHAVFAPKVDGALALHALTRRNPVEHFAVVGSASAWFGTPGQGAYAAANAWLDGFAAWRRAQGLPATAVMFGPWAGAGMAGRVAGAVKARWAEEGIGLLDPEEAVELLARARTRVAAARFDFAKYAVPRANLSVLRPFAPTGAAAVRPAEIGSATVAKLRGAPSGARRAMLLDHLHDTLGAVLGLPAGRRLDPRTGFFDAGMDSLTALELRNRLQRSLGTTLSATVAFDHPNAGSLADHLLAELDLAEASGPAEVHAPVDRSEPIAIVGVACRFPGGATSPDRFWDLLSAGRSAVREIPPERWPLDRYYDATPATPGKTYNRHAGLLDEIDTFDPAFFGISPREAEALDPQQRLLLETAWEALEDAAIDPRRLVDSPTGVFVGIGGSEYGFRFPPLSTGGEPDPYSGTGNESSFAAGRVAYVLGLRGPALSINTACSSSLVAVHQAVQALRNGECDLALAGGANAIVSPEITVQMAQLRALSPDGRCATFDASANGYVRGEGAGMIALRRLSDAIARGERIHAIVRGSAVNHDGRSSGLTVPNGAAQQAVIRSALAAGGVEPAEVGFVECHGTGTPLGDPIEVRALGEVYGRGREIPLRLGSVKTNVGHLEAGAGMAGLIKAILALQHRAIPPHLNLVTPNPALPLDEFHLTIPTALTPWVADAPRLAGVSSFGISGTNAHVVLQEAPADERVAAPSTRPLHLLAVSGRTPAAADAAARQLADVLETGVDVADAVFTANVGRANLEHRRVALGADRAALVAALRGEAAIAGHATETPRLVFLCTGAGPQAVHMGRELYDTEPVFHAAMDEAFAAVDRWLDRPLSGVIYPEPGAEEASPINLLAYTQPAMFAIEYAFAKLWESWGVRPDAVIGHSTGQYVAAVLAGVFSLADGARLICARSRLMSDEPEIGEMVAIFAAEERVAAAIDHPQVSIAAVNSAEEVVISGLREPVLAIAARFEAEGVEVRRLRISHAAHSPLMDPVLDRFEAVCREVAMHPPRIPLVENVRGEVAGDEITTPRYWREHMRQGVRFHAGMRTLAWLGFRHFLEIGNHPILCGNGARSLPDVAAWFYPSIRRKAPEWPQLLESAGRLWTAGVDLDWQGFHRHAPGRRIALPTYPFQRRRFWVERADVAEDSREVGAEWTYERVWRPTTARPTPGGLLLVVTDDPKLADGLGEVVVAPLESVEAAIDAHRPVGMVNLIPLSAPEPGTDPVGAARRATESTLTLLQLAARKGLPLAVVTAGATDAGGPVHPSQAPVWGLGTVAGVELPDVRFVRIDADPADPIAGLADALRTEDGEDLVALRGGRRLAARLVKSQRASAPVALKPDAAYLVTGGLGALGLAVAGWLVENGARHVVLVGRRAPGAAAEAVIARLGTSVSVVSADVSVAADVDRVLAGLEAPLAGVFHAAGVLDDAALLNLSWARFPKVWAAKVAGTWWLHEKTKHLPLDLFVGFSSAAAMIGSPGQGNYAAANAFLDAVIAMRRQAGLAGQSHAWGPWADAGLATETSRAWEAGGVTPLVPRSALAAMGRVLGMDTPLLAIAAIDWPAFAARLGRVPSLLAEVAERREAEAPKAGLKAELAALAPDLRRTRLASAVRKEVVRILRLEPDALDERTGFFDTGMDSLMAVELVGKLKSSLEIQLPATLAFDHPNVAALTDHLLGQLDLGEVRTAAPVAAAPLVAADEPVAIIGIACRYPGGANDPSAFWELLKSGRDPMVEVPPERWDIDAWWDPTPGTPGKMYTREAGFLDVAIDQFDSEFFGISPREANSMDPQQRLLLECAWEALENAGKASSALADRPTAVYVGAGDSGYLQRFQKPGGLLYLDQYAGTGNLSAFLAGRVAYVLGAHGPNLTLNTACSSSLVATHLASQALRNGECDLAIAAGVHLMLSPENFVYVSQIKAVSADGRCKTFDASANGYGRAEGCGVVVLRRLSDALRDGDPILAVLRGTAVGHDGQSSGLTVPNGVAQQGVIREALQRAGVAPADVSYIETHGTGTVLGDPIEVHAIEATYGVDRPKDRPLHIGAVKSNIGHMEVAAGVASLIKTVLALQHREVPPDLHFHTPNPDLDFDQNGFVVDTVARPWDWSPAPRRAGVSSFGLSGTNVHLVVEEAPERPAPAVTPTTRPAHLLTISARSRAALQALAGRYADLLGTGVDLADVAASARRDREAQDWRLAVVGADVREKLAAFATSGDAAGVVAGKVERTAPRVAFLFSGQGSQYAGMAKDLYAHEPSFRADVDRCAAILPDLPLLEVMFAGPDDERVNDTRFTQPALFVVEWALAQLWTRWGVTPAAVLGHSIGEIAAACYAGVFSLDDALRLVAARGALMADLPRDGSMYAAFAEGEQVASAMAPYAASVSVAAVNNPGETVISGKTDDVRAIADGLKAAGVDGRWLKVSHAFHSPLMEPVLDAFEAVARTIRYQPPKLPLVSNLGGGMAGAEVADPAYWRRHVREAVAFAAGIRTLRDRGIDTFVEVGPHPTLLGMARRTIPDLPAGAWLPSLKRDADAWTTLLGALGGLTVRGGSFDASAFDGVRRRVALPNYPWQRRRHWIAGEEFPGQESPLRDWTWEVEWALAPTAEPVAPRHVAIVADRGGLAAALERELVARGAQVTVADAPPNGADAVVFLPAVDLPGLERADAAALGTARERGPVALAALVAGLASRGGSTRLSIVTRGVQAVEPADRPNPLQGTVWGLARVIRVEHPELRARALDLEALAAPDEVKLLADAILAGDAEPEVALRRGRRYVPRLVPARIGAAPVAIRSDAAYWITGGLTGLGLELAKWLAGRGARRLVLTGRRAPSAEAQAVLAELAGKGVDALVLSADVAKSADVERTLAEIGKKGWELKGIVHAAGVLDDAVLVRQTPERFAKVFAPKVEGTWNLHRATAGRPLDFFTLFSGGASLMGSPGQGNYAAANAFLDSFALWRRAAGLPALAINWGAWADVGMAAALGAGHAAQQAAEGIRTIPVKTGMSLWGRLLGHQGQVAVMPVDWNRFAQVFHAGNPPPFLERVVTAGRAAPATTTQLAAASTRVPIEVDDVPPPPTGLPELFDRLARVPDPERPAVIDAWVHELVIRVLDFDRSKQLDRATPLLDVGLDSLLAVELKNAMADGGVDLPVARLMTGPSITVINQLVGAWVAEHPVEAPARPVATAGEAAPVVAADRPTWEQVGTWRPTAAAESGPPPGNAVATHIGAFVLGMVAIVAAYVLTQIGTDQGATDGRPGVEEVAPAPASKRPRR